MIQRTAARRPSDAVWPFSGFKDFAHECESNLAHISGHRLQRGNRLKQCSELILMISGQHPCNNYTSHIRPHFARVSPLNLFACMMRDLNKRPSFINAVIYIYDQCALAECARRHRAPGWASPSGHEPESEARARPPHKLLWKVCEGVQLVESDQGSHCEWIQNNVSCF